MPRFHDYNRTVVGYHGTRRKAALEIVQRKTSFKPSENNYDWLGHGIYFWEHAPQQAFNWARQRYRGEDIAVLGAMIRLGNCFDLLDPQNAKTLKTFHGQVVRDVARPLKNFRSRKYLDCAVFEYAYKAFKEEARDGDIDTCRAVYVPTEQRKRLWSNSWLYDESHIQLCVRNESCILGAWLVQEPSGE